ncbi:MAG: PKD domain-containing protein, partial [Myxococcota bacterium]|nr:PKD domain-containing protein [Myxococcota bacterium]
MPASPASRPSPWSRVPLLASCLGLFLALPVRPAEAKPQVIPVPYTLKDIKLPHPAYNKHPTTFKAIARPIGAEACETPLYRWDINGNGLWADDDPGDDCADKTEGAGGWIQASTRYNLECRAQLPFQNRNQVKKKLFVATVEVKCSANADSAYGNYYVMVFAEVPQGRGTRGSEPDTYAYTARPYLDSAGAPIPATCSNSKCAVTNFPCSANEDCEGDNDESLRIKRDVALDDAMWYLHKQVSGRSGHGSPTYTGYTHAGSNSYMTSYGWNVHKNASAVHLWVLSQNGHIPAYPGYVDGAEADAKVMSAEWKTANLYRYDNDPYAEDAGRLFNFIVSSHAASGSWPASNWSIDNSASSGTDVTEGDDGKAAIAGTNDGKSYWIYNHYLTGAVLGALSSSGMGGTTCQAGHCAGHSVEWMVQQVVDGVCNNQTRSPSYDGGWGYGARGGNPVGSLSQWATIGLEAADKAMSKQGVIVNLNCRNRVPNYLFSYQSTATGSGYYQLSGGHSNNTNPHLTGGLLVGFGWLGANKLNGVAGKFDTTGRNLTAYTNQQVYDRYKLAFDYIGSSWYWAGEGIGNGWEGGNFCDTATIFDGTQMGRHYGHYSIQKGLRTIEPEEKYVVNGGKNVDWFRDYSYYYINNQEVDGKVKQRCTSKAGAYSYVGTSTMTAWGEGLVLTPTLFDPDPVAAGAATPLKVDEGCQGGGFGKITFTHAQSYHLSQSRQIVDYQWLFDAPAVPTKADFEQVTWTGAGALPNDSYDLAKKAFHTTSKDMAPVWTYLSAGSYNAALRVKDDNDPPKYNIYVISNLEVLPQLDAPPSANALGPYVISEEQPLVLAGTASDPNTACRADALTAKWYIPADQAVADSEQLTGTLSWATLSGLKDKDGKLLPRNQAIPIKLVVRDSTGRESESFSTLTIYQKRFEICFTMMPPGTAGCNQEVTVDASCTRHPDPRREFRSFEWDWENDVDYVAQDPATFPFQVESVGKTQGHIYTQMGSYRLTLRVKDDAGTVMVLQKPFTVEAQNAPWGDAGGPYQVSTWLAQPWLGEDDRQGTNLLLDGSGSSDPDENCGDLLTSWGWDLDVNGTYTDAVGELPTVSWPTLYGLLKAKGLSRAQYIAHPLTGQPKLQLMLEVKDKKGNVGKALTTLTIYHNGPYAGYLVSANPAGCGQELQFDGTVSSHGHPNHAVVQYAWIFDLPEAGQAGVTPAQVLAAFEQYGAEAQGNKVLHKYEAFGTYYPVLRVTDDQGFVSLAYGQPVVVDQGNAAPEVDIGGPYAWAEGEALQLDARGTVDPNEDCGDGAVEFAWDLDEDGQYDDKTGELATVQWAEVKDKLPPGSYPADPRTGLPTLQIGLRVTDTAGAAGYATAQVPIYSRLPVPVPDWGPQPEVPIRAADGKAVVKLDGTGSYHGDPSLSVVSWSWKRTDSLQSVSGSKVDMTVDLNSLRAEWEGGDPIQKELSLTVTDNLGKSKSLPFTVRFRRLASNPPNIVFGVGQQGVFIEREEGFSLSATGTTDPDGNSLDYVGWDVTGDGVDDIVWNRALPGDDPKPALKLQLSWAAMAQYVGLQALGVHVLRLTVKDSTGVIAQDTRPLTILAQAILPRAAATPAVGSCSSWFTFDAAGTRHLIPDETVTTLRWDFGDETAADFGEIVEHKYQSFGVYTVTLTASDLAGREASTTLTVSNRDGNLPPVAQAGGPYFVDSELKTSLVLAGSATDPDAGCGDAPKWFRWDLDGKLVNGERTWEVGPLATGGTTVPWATIEGWLQSGLLPQDNVNHPIVLEVEDSVGGKAQVTTTLLVADGTPVAAFRVEPDVASCGQPLSFDATGSYHPAPGQQISKYEWDFNYQEALGFRPSDSHLDETLFQQTLPRVGAQIVALRVSDAEGRSSMVSHPVMVSGDNLPPIARAKDVEGGTGEPLLLDASPSQDPNSACGDTIQEYLWDFDGVLVNGQRTWEFRTSSPTLTVQPGEYAPYGFALADPFSRLPVHTLRLRVTDQLGNAGESDVALRLYATTPVADAAVQPASAGCSVDMVFDGSGSYHNLPTRGLQRYLWDFDVTKNAGDDPTDPDHDGIKVGDPDDDIEAEGLQVTHQYRRLGTYTALLRVVDEKGVEAVDTVTATLSFGNLKPVANPGGPYLTTKVNDQIGVLVNLDGSGSRDPNEPCDAIAHYYWDTDNDELYGPDDDSSALCGATDCVGAVVENKGNPTWVIGRSYRIGLKVIDSYGLSSDISDTTLTVSETVPPTVVLSSPNGGEVLSGQGTITLKVAHPTGLPAVVKLSVNDVPVGQQTVTTNSPAGAFVSLTPTFATTAFTDRKDFYRVKVVAELQGTPSVFSTVLSQAPFTIDNTAPLITVTQGDATLPQTDLAGAPYEFSASLDDQGLDLHPKLTYALQGPSDGAPVVVAALPRMYPLGLSQVTFRAVDWAGNQRQLVRTVLVEDGAPPELTPGVAEPVEAKAPPGTLVPLNPSAWDVCDASVTVTSDAPEGGLFRVGERVVHFTATDDSGNAATGSLTVRVNDTTSPTIDPRSVPVPFSVDQTSARGVAAADLVADLPRPSYTDNGYYPDELSCGLFVTLRDAADNEVPPPAAGYACVGPAFGERWFPPGETTVTWKVKDPAGNLATATVKVTVLDKGDPSVELLAPLPDSTVWLTGTATVQFKAADATDPNPQVSVTPLPAGQGAQPTPDAQGVYTVEYSEDGVYYVRITARDAQGNESTQTVPRFSIDGTPPVLEVREFQQDGLDPLDSRTWPLFFQGEEAAPRFNASDPLSGMKRVRVTVLPGLTAGGEAVVLERTSNLSGTPKTGPRFLGNLSCSDQEGLCSSGKLFLGDMRKGNQRLKLEGWDAVDNHAVVEAPFRIIDLAEALIIVRDRLAVLRQGEVPEGARPLLASIDQFLATGQKSLGRGHLGGALVSIEDAIKVMTGPALKLVAPVV